MHFAAFSGRVFLGCPTAGSMHRDIEAHGWQTQADCFVEYKGQIGCLIILLGGALGRCKHRRFMQKQLAFNKF